MTFSCPLNCLTRFVKSQLVGGWPAGYLHNAFEELNSVLPGTNPDSREIKFHVTWSYVKRQTAKMKLWPSVFSILNSTVKIFVFVANSRRHFSIFMWFNEGLQEKNTNSEVIFAVCRLTQGHVTSNLISLLADPDLELSGGEGGSDLLVRSCWLFSFRSFLLFLPKIRRGRGLP